MPLLQHYSKQVTESQLADVNNIGKYARSGGACTAAAFLKVSYLSWMMMDLIKSRNFNELEIGNCQYKYLREQVWNMYT